MIGGRVFFGHQSVGDNILNGIRELTQSDPVFPVVALEETSGCPDRVLVHCRIGRNGDPLSKTREFRDIVIGSLAEHIDVAVHKYCYADIDANTDVQTLFARYRETMRALAVLRPGVRLVHMTVPLVRVRTGPRAWVQRALGRSSPRVADNANRELYNDLLRREYQGHEPLFDLAHVESVPAAASNVLSPSSRRGLRAEYTDDGGHLNPSGRRHVASALLSFLSELVPAPAGARRS